MKYTIKGITLNAREITDIHNYYEATCTAEYIMENYDAPESLAMNYAHDIRRQMDKYGYDETEAIYRVLRR